MTLTLDAATAINPAARVFVETTTKTGRQYATAGVPQERGGYTIALGAVPTQLALSPQ